MHSVTLSRDLTMGFLPTPMASDATTGAIIGKNDTFIQTKSGAPRKINQNGQNGSVGLARYAILGMIPTPAVRDYKGMNNIENTKKKIADGERAHMGQLPNFIGVAVGETSQLNPLFVAEMMGFPVDWTELPFQNTEPNQ